MMNVKKAVIPAAGLGKRLLPITKVIPKEMFPIVNRPVIHYVVEEAILSNINEIIVIISERKKIIKEYFDFLIDFLYNKLNLNINNKEKFRKIIRDLCSVEFCYIRQDVPKGVGDAVLKAEKYVGNEPFAVMLPDNIVRGKIPCIRQLKDIFVKYKCSVIATEELPKEKIVNYGEIRGKQINTSLYLVEDIIEKPKIEEVKSNLSTVGRYIFTPEIFDCIKETKPGIGNEIQLTDSIRILKNREKVLAYKFKGKRYDTGNKVGYIQVIIDFALEEKNIKHELITHLKKVIRYE